MFDTLGNIAVGCVVAIREGKKALYWTSPQCGKTEEKPALYKALYEALLFANEHFGQGVNADRTGCFLWCCAVKHHKLINLFEVQIFGNDANESYLRSWRNWENK